MKSHGDGKQESADPENAMRLLELELMQQRMARQHAGTPYRGLRALSMVFLVVVVLGVLLAFYYVFFAGGLDEFRSRNAPGSTPSAISPNP